MKKFQSIKGFSLIELLIACAIIGILSGIAIPLYQGYVIKSRRVAAGSCVMEMAQYMERFYSSNMSYDKDEDGETNTLPAQECATNLSDFYTFTLENLSSTTYRIKATPVGVQTKDTDCGVLSLEHTGKKSVTGGGGASKCFG